MSNDNSHIEGVSDFLKNLRNQVILTRDEAADIIEPGIKVLEQKLKNNTPYDENGKTQYIYGKEFHHLKDGITHKKGQFADGSTDVGFDSASWPVANWVDHGTYRQHGQFFVEKTFDDLNSDELFDPIAKAAKKYLNKKQNE